MTTKTQALQKAASQIGKTESPAESNLTPYGAWYGMNGQPWCDIFVSWVFGILGAGAAIGGKFAYCPAHLESFQRRGRLYRTPAVGDVVFFKFPGAVVTGHAGIVEKVLPGNLIQTIEGNTHLTGSQNNGGAVLRRIRSSTSYIAGYGRPSYTGVVYMPPAISLSATSNPTKAIQTAVHVNVDGRWGPATSEAVRAVVRRTLANVQYLQARVGVSQDGQWGPASEAARIVAIKGVQRALGVAADGAWGAKSQSAYNAAYSKYYGR